jgi:fermentation-respiration switch protein FrsA (DUF1100 family)
MRRALFGAVVLLVLPFVGAFVAGEVLSKPARGLVGSPPDRLNAESVSVETETGLLVSGWFAPGEAGMGAVLLLHGIRADRRDMLGRALMLQELGYSVLLIDLPAHGESQGDRITFGFREANGVSAALEFLRDRLPGERIGVIAVSLGAASLVYANPDPAPDAVVLEAMYPTIEEAVEDRLALRLGDIGKPLAPLLLWQLPLRLGVTQDDLQPIVQLPKLSAPVLIVAGAGDLHTTLPETQRLFAAAQSPKELWVVDGAAHVDLYDYGPAAYKAEVVGFLARHLRPGD